MQDISGGAALLQTKYIVISEDLWRFRISAGYGSGPDRMDGVFAGGELKLHDWVYLLGDYDTRETNVGARVVLPQFWKVPARFTATVKTSLDYRPGNVDIAVGLSVPLDFRMKDRQGAAQGRLRLMWLPQLTLLATRQEAPAFRLRRRAGRPLRCGKP